MIGTGEMIVILAVVLILFGGKRLPEFAKNLGKGIREFKRACDGKDEAVETVEIEPEDKRKLPEDKP